MGVGVGGGKRQTCSQGTQGLWLQPLPHLGLFPLLCFGFWVKHSQKWRLMGDLDACGGSSVVQGLSSTPPPCCPRAEDTHVLFLTSSLGSGRGTGQGERRRGLVLCILVS